MKINENENIFENNDDDSTENLTFTEFAEEIFEEPVEEETKEYFPEEYESSEETEEGYNDAEPVEKSGDNPDSEEDEKIEDFNEFDENEIEESEKDIYSNSFFNVSEENENYNEETDSESEEDEDKEKKDKKDSFIASLWKNKRRRAKLAYGLVSLLLVLVGTGYGFINAMLDKVQSDNKPETGVEDDGVGDEVIYDEEDFELFSAVNSAGSVNDYIDQWYESGESMYSKNVINVLLVGLDSKNGLKTGDSRSDTMMIVSLNTKTKKISMVSLFRDTWAKFIPSDGKAQFGKMNGSYRYGGINCTIQTIEKMFKIKIDHYAIVDFKNFVKLVDAVGGVDLYVQEYESKNMKREWNIDVPFSQDENDLIHLDGTQAFWFARQRHCDVDADVSRTRRQRQVITAFIDSCKGASFSQISDALNNVFSLVKTDLKKTEILGYATKALAWGWLKYQIESVKISDPSVFQTPTLFGASIVVQDYPAVSQIIQEALYGTSNIVLEDGRKIIFSLYR